MIHQRLDIPAGTYVTITTQRFGTKEGLLQWQSQGECNVIVSGRLTPSAPWTQMANISASSIQWMALAPEMKFEVQGADPGSVYLME